MCVFVRVKVTCYNCLLSMRQADKWESLPLDVKSSHVSAGKVRIKRWRLSPTLSTSFYNLRKRCHYSTEHRLCTTTVLTCKKTRFSETSPLTLFVICRYVFCCKRTMEKQRNRYGLRTWKNSTQMQEHEQAGFAEGKLKPIWQHWRNLTALT